MSSVNPYTLQTSGHSTWDLSMYGVRQENMNNHISPKIPGFAIKDATQAYRINQILKSIATEAAGDEMMKSMAEQDDVTEEDLSKARTQLIKDKIKSRLLAADYNEQDADEIANKLSQNLAESVLSTTPVAEAVA